MILDYRGYRHPDHEAMVTFFGAARVYNPRGRAQLLRKRMVVEGEIIGANTAEIDARVAEIQDAYTLDGGRAMLLDSNGGQTNYVLLAGAINGPRIVEGPTFIQQEGKAHFTTGLPFRIVIEADYLISDTDPLVHYAESITAIGTGGPRRVIVELDSGVPIEQIVSTNTPLLIVQSGEAVGSTAYPALNGPIFPQYIDNPDGYQVTRSTPRLEGNLFMDHVVRWNYRMTMPSPVSVPFSILR